LWFSAQRVTALMTTPSLGLMEDASTVGGRAAPVVGRRNALALVRAP